MSRPEIRPAQGKVINQPMYIQATMRQLILLHVPLQKPTPTVAPHMHWVVETGSLSLVAMMMVMAAPSSIEKPRDGECSVILLPSARMML